MVFKRNLWNISINIIIVQHWEQEKKPQCFYSFDHHIRLQQLSIQQKMHHPLHVLETLGLYHCCCSKAASSMPLTAMTTLTSMMRKRPRASTIRPLQLNPNERSDHAF